jgi:hypothetical protein
MSQNSSPIRETCANCRFSDHIEGSTRLQCRRHAPSLLLLADQSATDWAIVLPGDWCGEHEPKDDKARELRGIKQVDPGDDRVGPEVGLLNWYHGQLRDRHDLAELGTLRARVEKAETEVAVLREERDGAVRGMRVSEEFRYTAGLRLSAAEQEAEKLRARADSLERLFRICRDYTTCGTQLRSALYSAMCEELEQLSKEQP